MRDFFFSFLLLSIGFLPIGAQTFERTDLGIKAKMQSQNLEVPFFSPEIVKSFHIAGKE